MDGTWKQLPSQAIAYPQKSLVEFCSDVRSHGIYDILISEVTHWVLLLDTWETGGNGNAAWSNSLMHRIEKSPFLLFDKYCGKIWVKKVGMYPKRKSEYGAAVTLRTRSMCIAVDFAWLQQNTVNLRKYSFGKKHEPQKWRDQAQCMIQLLPTVF